ncbi:MAG: recombinase RecT, partial [Candidatus Kapabacteria bacterium]|nr:recombinase RecT [Candidatus Kapabacteria bacterium]
MSAIEKFNPEQQMLQVRDRFVAVAQSKIDFDKEKAFAIQILNNSEYLFAAAQQNPESLMNAVYNVALTGLTLNPVLKFAYLLPRKKKVILEPSYMGLIKILTDAGVVKSIRSYVVRKADLFSYELGTQPYIKHVPSDSGGEIIAAYAIAELTDGGMQFEVMTRQQIDIIMNRSDSVIAGKASPWKSD